MSEDILSVRAGTSCPQRNNTTVVKVFLYLSTLHCLPPLEKSVNGSDKASRFTW